MLTPATAVGRALLLRSILHSAPGTAQIGEVVLHLATATYTTGHEYLCTGGAELGYGTKNRRVPGGSGTAQ